MSVERRIKEAGSSFEYKADVLQRLVFDVDANRTALARVSAGKWLNKDDIQRCTYAMKAHSFA